MPPMIAYQLCALTIAALFYVWRDKLQQRVRDTKLLRERVAYMLWVSANR